MYYESIRKFKYEYSYMYFIPYNFKVGLISTVFPSDVLNLTQKIPQRPH